MLHTRINEMSRHPNDKLIIVHTYPIWGITTLITRSGDLLG